MASVYYDVYPQLPCTQILPDFPSFMQGPGQEGSRRTEGVERIPHEPPIRSMYMRTLMQYAFWPDITTGDDSRPHYLLKSTYHINRH